VPKVRESACLETRKQGTIENQQAGTDCMQSPSAGEPPKLEIKPAGLTFKVNPEKKAGKLAICNNTITLQNPYDVDVCFKIKTTAPKRYQVKPNAKRIAAHSSLSITVTLSSPTDEEFTKKPDKFLVQAAWMPEQLDDKEIMNWWKRLDKKSKELNAAMAFTKEKPSGEQLGFSETKLKSMVTLGSQASPAMSPGKIRTQLGATTLGATKRLAAVARSSTTADRTAPSATASTLAPEVKRAPSAPSAPSAVQGNRQVGIVTTIMAMILSFLLGYFL